MKTILNQNIIDKHIHLWGLRKSSYDMIENLLIEKTSNHKIIFLNGKNLDERCLNLIMLQLSFQTLMKEILFGTKTILRSS